jgi:hypothetical protein
MDHDTMQQRDSDNEHKVEAQDGAIGKSWAVNSKARSIEGDYDTTRQQRQRDSDIKHKVEEQDSNEQETRELRDYGKAQDARVGYVKAQDGAIGKSWAVNSKARSIEGDYDTMRQQRSPRETEEK